MKKVAVLAALFFAVNGSLTAGNGKDLKTDYTINADRYTVDLVVDHEEGVLHVLINGAVNHEMVVSLINVRGQEAFHANLTQLKKEYSINPVNYSVDLKVDQHQEKLYVLINGTFKNEMVISLINVRGQEAYYDNLKELNKEYKTTIDLSQLGKGLYFFKIDSGDEIRLKKITL